MAWPGHYLVTGGGGDRTIDAGSPRGGSPAAPAGAVTTEGMETGATVTTTRQVTNTNLRIFITSSQLIPLYKVSTEAPTKCLVPEI